MNNSRAEVRGAGAVTWHDSEGSCAWRTPLLTPAPTPTPTHSLPHPHSPPPHPPSPPFLSLLRDRNVDWDYDGNGSHGMLACWVERECAMAMACHVTTGVEVELVKPTQLRMTYW